MDVDMDGKQSCVHGWHEETRTEEGNVALLNQGEWVHGKGFRSTPTCMHANKGVARSVHDQGGESANKSEVDGAATKKAGDIFLL